MTNTEKLGITVTSENCGSEDCFCGYFNDSSLTPDNCSPQQVINELNCTYRSLVQKIDSGNGDSELKIQTLLSWIKDLEEQNNVLVETVEQLEKEAAHRVALLDERLQQTSHTALRYMTKLQDYDNHLQEVYRKHSVNTQNVNKEDKAVITDLDPNLENEIWKKKFHETETELLKTKLELKAVHNELCDSRSLQETQGENSELQFLKDENARLRSELKNNNDQLRSQKLQHSEMTIKLDNVYKYYSKEVDDLKNEIATKNAKITDLNYHIIELNEQVKDNLSKMKYEGYVIKNLRDKLKSISSQEEDQTFLPETIEGALFHNNQANTTNTDTMGKRTTGVSEVPCRNLQQDKIKNLESNLKDAMLMIETLKSQKRAESSNSNSNIIQSLQTELNEARKQLETLKYNQEAKDKMIINQKKMLELQEQNLLMTQNELKEMNEKLLDYEKLKHHVTELESAQESLKTLECSARNALLDAERKNEEQQLTITNLQQALLSTKQQLEALQGKGVSEEMLVKKNNGHLKTIQELQMKIKDLQQLLGESRSKYQQAIMACENYEKEADTIKKSESAYAEKYAEVRAESAFLKSQVKKLQIQQEMANMEVKHFYRILKEEMLSSLSTKYLFETVTNQLITSLNVIALLHQVKSLLEIRNDNLTFQNTVLNEEKFKLLQELSQSNKSCKQLCDEFCDLINGINCRIARGNSLKNCCCSKFKYNKKPINELLKEKKLLKRALYFSVKTLQNCKSENVCYLPVNICSNSTQL